MRYTLLLLLILVAVAIGVLYTHQRSPAAAVSSGCIDIVATPDYLSTGSPYDAIAAIDNARQTEHLRTLHLPKNFYQLNPAQQQFILINLERTDRGLRPLQIDANLAQMAWGYSKQLLDLNFFAHTSPIGGTFSDRVDGNAAIANHYSQAAENLAGNPLAGIGPMYEYMYDDTVENCGHRHNILNPTLALVGINWIHGSTYGSLSAQEFLTSAPWSPYVGATPNTIAPELMLSVNSLLASQLLQCQALAHSNSGAVRITWFLDHVDSPLHIGPFWTLDTRHLSRGKHTLFVYAVDGEQNYAMAKYVFVV